MKYFAILKDSFREALDSKVLIVMLALSTMVILVVATFSFKPVSAQITMEQFFPDQELKGISLMFLALYNQEMRELSDPFERQKGKPIEDDPFLSRLQRVGAYRLEKVAVLGDGEPDSPNSDYVLTISDIFPPFKKEADQDAARQTAKKHVRGIFQRAEDFGLIRIGDIETEPIPGPLDNEMGVKLRYQVKLHSTPQTIRLWGHSATLFFVWKLPLPPAPLGYQMYILSRVVILFGSWIAINVGVIVTSFFFPNMLSKGTIDLLLSKPIHRWAFIVYKYIGGLTFIFLNALYAIGGMWLVLGLRTGIWPTGCLLLVFTMTFFFAILYAISTYVSVITRSTIASIMLTLLAWVFFFAVGWGHGKIHELALAEKISEKLGKVVPPEERWDGSGLAIAMNVLYFLTPRTEDLNQLNDRIVYCDLVSGSVANMADLHVSRQPWRESLLVAAVWIAVFLGLAALWFTFKDY